ncbi:MAG: hypothetical protein BroJett040_10080 [Oligoflexia bacterium]|nr:MAG: hypothetical protein BroJett040_10080 [Oligoflexia bacterium]
MNSSPETSRQDQIAQKIVEFLSQNNKPQSESAILSAVSGRRKDKIDVIRMLRAQGSIAFRGSGKKGDPFLYSVPSSLVEPSQNSAAFRSGNTPQVITKPTGDSETPPIFKTYKLPNGDVLSLSRGEFDEIVDLFRLLLRQSEKSVVANSQTEKEILEPEGEVDMFELGTNGKE